MSEKEPITEQYQNPMWKKETIGEAYDSAIQSVLGLKFDSDKVPSWLRESFICVALDAMEETIIATERLAIDGVLPKRYSEFEEAHRNNNRPYSVLILLVTEYFVTGRIANGITREDIQSYDPDLMVALNFYEGVYGDLPTELYIPKNKSGAGANAKVALGHALDKR